MQIVKAAGAYFGVVFCVGFLLGAIRSMIVAPRVGERRAELMEAPFMLIASIVAAQWTVAYFGIPHLAATRARIGVLALMLLVIAELATVRVVRRVSIREYFATRDRVAEAVYYALVVLYGMMPVVVR